MFRSLAALWRVAAMVVLVAGLAAAPAEASKGREARALAERAAVAVAEAQAKRARGQRVWCVPFARTLSGIEIKGNAKTWWAAAEGRYDRGAAPRIGAVMSFRGTKGMPLGHVAVVSAVVDERTVRIDHANWSRNKVSLGMAVVDVSEKGDWTRVRVESQPGAFGRVYPVNGFIYPAERLASN